MVDACVANGILPYYGPVRRHQGHRRLRGPVPQRLPARLRRRLEPAPEPDRHRQAGVLARPGRRGPRPRGHRGDGRRHRRGHARRQDGGRRQRQAVPASWSSWPSSWPTATPSWPPPTGSEEQTDDDADDLRPRRSVLYMPGANERALEKARSPPGRRAHPRPRGRGRARRQGRGPRPRVRGGRARTATAAARSPSGSTGSTRRGTPTTCAAAAEAGPDAVARPEGQLGRRRARGRGRARGRRRARPRPRIWAMLETPQAMLSTPSRSPAPPSGSTVLVMGTNDLAKELHAEQVPGRQPLLVRALGRACWPPATPAR